MNTDVLINIVLVVVIIVTGVIISGYNALIRGRNHVEESESNIQIYLKERFDLVPNLVEVVKGYTKHESETFAEVTKARQNYEGKEKFSVKDVNNAEQSINRLIAVAESYPDLKASPQYLSLSRKLGEIEDEIEQARRIYNRVATNYNTKVQTVPSSAIAKMFNFKKKELFKLSSEKEAETVAVKL